MSKGYIYVASLNYLYYQLALESAQSLRDVYPEANITLYTHDTFVDDRAEQIFDNIVTGIPIHRRAKMWCMARTPYDQTFYNDVDSALVHPDISKVFDGLDDKIYMCENLLHTVSRMSLMWIDKSANHFPFYHGAVAWYKKTDYNLDFINTWWSEYVKQLAEPWPYPQYDEIWKKYDMFTLWKLHSGALPEYDKFKGAVQTGDRRFNCTIVDGGRTHTKLPPVNIQIPRNIFATFDTMSHKLGKPHNAPTYHDKHYNSEASIEYN